MTLSIPRIDWTLRKATLDDAAALSTLMHAAYEIYEARLNDVTLPPMRANYGDEIRNYPVWVAEFEGRLIGGLILSPEPAAMTVANIAVHPQFQGAGLGKALMDHAEAQAKAQKYDQLRLATHVALTENLTFYTRLGWTETDRDDVRIYMRKMLEPR